jgi:ubiquinone/menaquinone biosynthesis C-methylase UbiE
MPSKNAKASQTLQRGDFTQLAAHYHNRVGYSRQVLGAIARLLPVPMSKLKVADVGAGTGKLTEELLGIGATVIAVEPNDAMRAEGMKQLPGGGVTWRKGSGEETGLEAQSVDWVTMGSSFHWVDLEKGLKEFHRILRPGGAFTAVWNPRDLERSAAQSRIDARLKQLVPGLTRVSSGGKGYASDWFTKLESTPYFANVLFMEAKMDVAMSRERYLGIWDSVNDVRAQCTPKVWDKFLDEVRDEIGSAREVVVPYATRAWTVWRK